MVINAVFLVVGEIAMRDNASTHVNKPGETKDVSINSSCNFLT